MEALRFRESSAFEDVVSRLAAHLVAEVLRQENYKKSQAEGLAKQATVPTWQWTCNELLHLLQQYPGGISKAVAYTHTLERWTSTKAERKTASRRSHQPGLALLSVSAARGTTDCMPFCLEAEVASSSQKHGQPPVLVLRDLDKKDISMDAYMHSRLVPLLHGACPILQAGQKLRIGGCTLVKVGSTLPTQLLPSEALACLVDCPQQAQELMQGALCSLSQVVAASGQAGVIDGILHAVVASPPAAVVGRSPACIWLEDPFTPLQSGHVGLRLSNQQAGFAGLVASGEHMLLMFPAIDTSGPTSSLQMSEESVVCIIPSKASGMHADKETQNSSSNGSRGEEGRVLFATLKPGSTDATLIGIIVSMELQSVGLNRTLQLVLEDESGRAKIQMTDLGQSLRAIFACRPGHTVFIAGVSVGVESHEGVWTEEGESNAPQATCSWSEAHPGSSIQSLTALPALLASPLFHPSSVTLPTCPLQPARVALCDLTLVSRPHVTVRRAHAVCGRVLTRASLGLADLFEDPPGPESDARPAKRLRLSSGGSAGKNDRSPPASQPGTKEACAASLEDYQDEERGGWLWTCPFCGVECGAQSTLPNLLARLRMTDAAGCTAEGIASGSVVNDLIHMPSLAFMSLAPDQQNEALQQLVGRPLRVSLYQRHPSSEVCESSKVFAVGSLKWE